MMEDMMDDGGWKRYLMECWEPGGRSWGDEEGRNFWGEEKKNREDGGGGGGSFYNPRVWSYPFGWEMGGCPSVVPQIRNFPPSTIWFVCVSHHFRLLMLFVDRLHVVLRFVKRIVDGVHL